VKRKPRILSGPIGLLLALSFSPEDALAQGFPDVESEIPLPSLTGSEARAMGMGGAGIAIAEDGSAVMWNPAGLAQIRRIEMAATVVNEETEISNVWEGTASTAKSSSTNLGSFHLVFPFPTYRGSLVMALGNDQFRNYDSEYVRHDVEGPPGARIDKFDTINESGKLHGWSFALAIEASPKLYLGGALFIHDGDDHIAVNQITTDLDNANPDTLQLDDLIETDSDISGFTGNFGFLYRPNRHIRFGATVRTTTSLTFHGSQRISEITRFDDGDAVEFVDEIFFEDDFDFPVSVGSGLAISAGWLTLAGDVRYTDWTQTALNGSPFLSSFIGNQFTDKTSYYAGGEFIVFGSPLRVRGGYTWDPVPFRLFYETGGVPIEVTVDKDREFVSVGAGLLFDTVFTLDAAMQVGSFTRTSIPYSEEREYTRFFVTGAYRF
jgi:long-subunit fatty acid transport protein